MIFCVGLLNFYVLCRTAATCSREKNNSWSVAGQFSSACSCPPFPPKENWWRKPCDGARKPIWCLWHAAVEMLVWSIKIQHSTWFNSAVVPNMVPTWEYLLVNFYLKLFFMTCSTAKKLLVQISDMSQERGIGRCILDQIQTRMFCLSILPLKIVEYPAAAKWWVREPTYAKYRPICVKQPFKLNYYLCS